MWKLWLSNFSFNIPFPSFGWLGSAVRNCCCKPSIKQSRNTHMPQDCPFCSSACSTESYQNTTTIQTHLEDLTSSNQQKMWNWKPFLTRVSSYLTAEITGMVCESLSSLSNASKDLTISSDSTEALQKAPNPWCMRSGMLFKSWHMCCRETGWLQTDKLS